LRTRWTGLHDRRFLARGWPAIVDIDPPAGVIVGRKFDRTIGRRVVDVEKEEAARARIGGEVGADDHDRHPAIGRLAGDDQPAVRSDLGAVDGDFGECRRRREQQQTGKSGGKFPCANHQAPPARKRVEEHRGRLFVHAACAESSL